MKKALIVANTAGLITDFLDNDCCWLRVHGYKIHIACSMQYKGKDTEAFFVSYADCSFDVDFPVRNIQMKKIKDSFAALKEIIKKGQYAVVHCHSTIAAAICRQAILSLPKNERPIVIYTSHGLPFYEGCSEKKQLIYKLIESHYSKNTDAIITICKEDYQNAKAMKCNNVFYIPGVGVDVEPFENCCYEKEQNRDSLSIPQNSTVLLSIGELNTNKNHELVVRALANRFNNCTYLICGREVTEIGKRQQLEELAQTLGVNVRFLGFRKDIPKICGCADIGVLPSFKEGLGLSGIEMLASGLPVLGSNRQGIKDYVVDGVTGYLFDPTNIEDFVRALTAIRADMIKGNDYAMRCRKMANRFSKAEAAVAVSKIYEIELSPRKECM